MMEPRRLLDDPTSSVTRTLLRAALDEPAPSGASARTQAALGVGAASLAAAPTAAVAAASGAKTIFGVPLGVFKWLAGSIVVGGVVATSLAPSRKQGTVSTGVREPAVEPRVGSEPPVNTKRVVDDLKEPTVEPDPSPLGVSPSPARPKPSSSTRVAVPQASNRSDSPADALNLEIALLDAARQALARGDANAALAVLDRHESEHPAGRLRPEALVLKLEALVQSGDIDAARALGRSLLEKQPNGGAYAARIKKIVGQ